MAVHRTPPTCHLCGEEYVGIYKDQTNVPVGHQFVGDTFIMWDYAGHNCRFKKENRPSIEQEAARLAQESKKFQALFVDWELSKKLKVLGFNEPCFAYFWALKDTFHYTVRYEDHNAQVARASAPLWQQVIDWLDSKKLFIDVDHEFGEDWTYTIDNGSTGHSGDDAFYITRQVATRNAVVKAVEILELVGISKTNYKGESNG